jgi:hypothetical protein
MIEILEMADRLKIISECDHAWDQYFICTKCGVKQVFADLEQLRQTLADRPSRR